MFTKSCPCSIHTRSTSTIRSLILDNVVLTPHSAGSSIEALQQLKLDGAREAITVLSGRPPQNWVNPSVISRFPLQGMEATP